MENKEMYTKQEVVEMLKDMQRERKRKGLFVAMQKSVAGKLLYLKITVMLIVWLIGLTLQKNGSIF